MPPTLLCCHTALQRTPKLEELSISLGVSMLSHRRTSRWDAVLYPAWRLKLAVCACAVAESGNESPDWVKGKLTGPEAGHQTPIHKAGDDILAKLSGILSRGPSARGRPQEVPRACAALTDVPGEFLPPIASRRSTAESLASRHWSSVRRWPEQASLTLMLHNIIRAAVTEGPDAACGGNAPEERHSSQRRPLLMIPRLRGAQLLCLQQPTAGHKCTIQSRLMSAARRQIPSFGVHYLMRVSTICSS